MTLSHVLVTGGAGYVGSVVCNHLLQSNYSVTALDNLSFGSEGILSLYMYPRFSFLRSDIRDLDTVSKAMETVDCVIHLAAIVGDPACSQQPEQAQEINYEATCRLASLSKERGVSRFVFASTCSNYGMSDTSSLASEESPLNPLSLYSRTKVMAEKFILDLTDKYYHPCVLRISTAFGLSARMRFDLLINEFVRDAILNRKLVVYGDQFWRPYIHTTDIAKAIARCVQAPAGLISGQTFNVGCDASNYQKAQIVDMIKQQVDGTVIERVPQDTDPRDYRVSFSKIKKMLEFQPERSVEQGISEIIGSFEQGVFNDPYEIRYRNSK